MRRLARAAGLARMTRDRRRWTASGTWRIPSRLLSANRERIGGASITSALSDGVRRARSNGSPRSPRSPDRRPWPMRPTWGPICTRRSPSSTGTFRGSVAGCDCSASRPPGLWRRVPSSSPCFEGSVGATSSGRSIASSTASAADPRCRRRCSSGPDAARAIRRLGSQVPMPPYNRGVGGTRHGPKEPSPKETGCP